MHVEFDGGSRGEVRDDHRIMLRGQVADNLLHECDAYYFGYTHYHDILSSDVVSLPKISKNPIDIVSQISSSLVEGLVDIALSIFDDEGRLSSSRFEWKIEMTSDRLSVCQYGAQLLDSLSSLSARFGEFGPRYESI